MAILSTTTNYPLVTSVAGWSLSGPGGLGIGGGGGYWNYISTTTGSSNTGPSVPPPGPDIYYWYCETSGTSLGSVFQMLLLDTLDSAAYNYTIDFYYSNYGTDADGECLVQYWNGVSWDTVQTIGWNASYPGPWLTATPIDLSGYNNSDGQLRWRFTTGGSTAHRNDFALDDITITVELASSSSTSFSSSSTSFSSSSRSSSSRSSSSAAGDLILDGLGFNYGAGNADWFLQGATVHTGPDALQGGNINDNQSTRIDLINPGAGDLSFYWKVSSESGWDYLNFYINGGLQIRISGTVDWTQLNYHIDPGDTVYWIYSKDSSQSTGSDTGWLDTFVFVSDSSSSSSKSSSSSSTSSSSSSSSISSSSSSSSTSIAIGTWTWGHQTGVVADYAVSFEDGEIMPWQGIIEGVGDNEHMIIYPGQRYALSEPGYVGIRSNIKLDYNQYAGSRDDSRFGDILYRTGATRQLCLSADWQPYNQSVDIVSLGWVQVSFTVDSSSSYSSSSSSSVSLNCQWESFNGGPADWGIDMSEEGKSLASWDGSVWTSVLDGIDTDISGAVFGVASYIYLVPKLWTVDYRPEYVRVTHDRKITDTGVLYPNLQILNGFSNKDVEKGKYLSDTITSIVYLPGGDMALFKFYHTGATPMSISNIEFCKSSSSSISSSSSSSSKSSSSSSLSNSSSSTSLSSSSSSSTDPNWVSYFDNTKWAEGGFKGVWNGAENRWESEDRQLYIETTGTWYLGYRPSKIRVTFVLLTGVSPEGMNIDLYSDCVGWVSLTDPTSAYPTRNSLEEITIVAQGADFCELDMVTNPTHNYYVTNIEFYEGSISSSSTSSSSSSST